MSYILKEQCINTKEELEIILNEYFEKYSNKDPISIVSLDLLKQTPRLCKSVAITNDKDKSHYQIYSDKITTKDGLGSDNILNCISTGETFYIYMQNNVSV